MSADREQDHLDMMSDMVDRHWNQPYCYASTREQDEEADPLYQRLKAAHSQIYVTTTAKIEERR